MAQSPPTSVAPPTAEPSVSEKEPYYLEIGDEVEIFQAAYDARFPVLLKGPTGCGKTRFVEAMAWRLFGPSNERESLITVACHEDLTATDLVGRYLLQGEDTVWIDGPLTRAVRQGGLCYLDEIVEARKDTIVLIHALTDHRRILPVEKRSEILDAHPEFLLVLSYNPGYQSVLKDLKPSTRQRFVSLEFDYPTIGARNKDRAARSRASTPRSPSAWQSSATRCAIFTTTASRRVSARVCSSTRASSSHGTCP